MNFDANDTRLNSEKAAYICFHRENNQAGAVRTKTKVKFVDDRVLCQKIDVPIPAIISFSLPRGWTETGAAEGNVPGQHGHTYHPKGNEKIALRFYCAGNRASESTEKLLNRLLKEDGKMPALDDGELKFLVKNYQTQVTKILSAKTVVWNGRKVIECEYLAKSAGEPQFDGKRDLDLRGWTLIYDNKDEEGSTPLPASIDFLAPEADFKSHLQTVQFAAKSIVWNKNWPQKAESVGK